MYGNSVINVNAIEFSIVSCPKNDLNDVSFGNLKSQKDHKVEIFVKNNMLHFVLKCTYFCKYVKTQMIAWAI